MLPTVTAKYPDIKGDVNDLSIYSYVKKSVHFSQCDFQNTKPYWMKVEFGAVDASENKTKPAEQVSIPW